MKPLVQISRLVARREDSAKKRETHRCLVETALRLFLSRGYDQTTVDDIAGCARISLRTLFRYYPTKESLALAFHDYWLERFRCYLNADSGRDVVEQWRAHVVESSRSLKDAQQEYLSYSTFLQDTPSLRSGLDRIVSEYRLLIAQASARSRHLGVDEDLYSHILAALLTSTNAFVNRQFIASGGKERIEELFPASVDYAMSLFRRDSSTS